MTLATESTNPNEREEEEAIPQPGVVIGSRYVVDSLLGKGGMSVVLRARDTRLGQMVAIKLLRGSQDRGSAHVGRFLREARTIAKLRSPHVVSILDVDAEASPPYFAMELLEGSTLADLLAARGRFAPGEALQVMLQACRGVADVHGLGVIHRDLKPSNLIVERLQDGSQRVKVIDFGIAKALRTVPDLPELTLTGQILGSPRYMSPEQVRSGERVDLRADVWALGAILYELIAGTSPFEAPTLADTLARIVRDTPMPLRAHRSDLPERLEAVVTLCLSKDPALRPPGVRVLLQELEAMAPHGPLCLDEMPSREFAVRGSVTTESTDKRSWSLSVRSSPRRSRWHGLVGLALASLAVAGWLGRPSSHSGAPLKPSPPALSSIGASGSLGPAEPAPSRAPEATTATPLASATTEPSATDPIAPVKPRPAVHPSSVKPPMTADDDLALWRRD